MPHLQTSKSKPLRQPFLNKHFLKPKPHSAASLLQEWFAQPLPALQASASNPIYNCLNCLSFLRLSRHDPSCALGFTASLLQTCWWDSTDSIALRSTRCGCLCAFGHFQLCLQYQKAATMVEQTTHDISDL